MSFGLDGEGRMRRFSRWGVESGGLRAASILAVQAMLLVLASAFAHGTGLRVDVVSVGVVFCALEVGLFRGLMLVAGLGYLGELYAGQPHGLWMTGAIAAFATLRLFVFRVAGAGALTVIVLCVFAAFVGGLARIILQSSTGSPTASLGQILGLAVTAGGIGYPAYLLFRWASDRFRAREESLFR